MSEHHCAVVYTRFSPRPDAATSESCEVQEQYCRELAGKRGLTVVGVFNDPDRSGADEYRERLWEAIKALKKGYSLIVYKRDRLARNVYLAEMINRAVEKRGGRIVAVSGDVDGDGPEQQLVRQVVSAMAEYERKIISKRTSDAMHAKQRKGWRMSGTPPYGWKIDQDDHDRIVEDPAEQETIRRMREMRASGMSYIAISNKLNADRVVTKQGGVWHQMTVRNILLRKMGGVE